MKGKVYDSVLGTEQVQFIRVLEHVAIHCLIIFNEQINDLIQDSKLLIDLALVDFLVIVCLLCSSSSIKLFEFLSVID